MVGALDTHALDERMRGEPGSCAGVALERAAGGSDRRGGGGDAEVLVEVVADPVLELGR